VTVDEENDVTVGKFYATFLIQDYFRRFKKRKEQMRKASVREHASALQVSRPSHAHRRFHSARWVCAGEP